MKNLLIIQARMGSERLPGKVLKPLGSSIVLDYVVSRCQQIKPLEDVIVATSTFEQDNPIVEWCNKNNVTSFRGSEKDVLSRYYECAKPHDPDYIIRVTADCPFVDQHLANQLIQTMQSNPSDVVLLAGARPRGLVVEMFSFKAIEKMHKITTERIYREHVTSYAYRHLEEFTKTELEIGKELQHGELRITLDTTEDYELCKKIAGHFKDNKLVSSAEVVRFLLDNPEIAKINSNIQQKEL